MLEEEGGVVGIRGIFYRLLGRSIGSTAYNGGSCLGNGSPCEFNGSPTCKHGNRFEPFVFTKTDANYRRLASQLVCYRQSGTIPMGAIPDVRTEEAVVSSWEDAEDYTGAVERGIETRFKLDAQDGQDRYIEVGCEAVQLVPMLVPIVAEFGIPVYSGSGSVSLPARYELGKRAVEQVTTVLYIGDWDKAGRDISGHLEADSRAWAESFGATGDALGFERIGVTPEQVEEYDLPYALNEMLDAQDSHSQIVQAEALSRAQLEEILRDAIGRHHDDDIRAATLERQEAERTRLTRWFESAEFEEEGD